MTTKKKKYWGVLTEGASIAQEREEQYGDITKNFSEISSLCDAMFGLEVSPSDIAKIMIATKFARNKHKQKRDNIIDAINYTAIMLELEEQELSDTPKWMK